MIVPSLLTLLAALAAASFAWRLGGRVVVPVPYGLQAEFAVLGFEGGEREGIVRLPAPPERPPQFARTDATGRYGLVWATPTGIGHGRLGPVTTRDDGSLERPLEVVVGPPPVPGTPARLDVALHRRDPLADHGVSFEELRIPGPVGDVAAWWIERDGDAAVVMVHGRRRADRTEALRALPVVLARDVSVLVTSYRNHDESASSPSGLFTYGQDEADDLLAALAFLHNRGVRRVAVVSYSMGSAVTLVARERWPADAPTLLGIAMDSPLLDPREVVRYRVHATGMPWSDRLAAVALAVAGRRAGIRWGPLDLRRLAPSLDVPVLLIAGTHDQTVPIALADDFALAAPRTLLTYWRVAGAEHVEAYNLDPSAYDARLGAFLDGLMAR